MLPDGNGIEVTRSLRGWSKMPILVLSAVGEEDEGPRARGRRRRLRDQAVRPARAGRAPAGGVAPGRSGRVGPADLGRRAATSTSPPHAVRVDGDEVHLTPIEFSLLRALALNRGRLLTHRALLIEVWGPEYADDVQVLRVHIANLRRKLGDRSAYIRTEPGVGYRFAG